MIVLHGFTGSGNCYKPALAMRQLGIAYRWQEVDILNGESRSPAFLARNANGRTCDKEHALHCRRRGTH